jgi:hypothetical protein
MPERVTEVPAACKKIQENCDRQGGRKQESRIAQSARKRQEDKEEQNTKDLGVKSFTQLKQRTLQAAIHDSETLLKHKKK